MIVQMIFLNLTQFNHFKFGLCLRPDLFFLYQRMFKKLLCLESKKNLIEIFSLNENAIN